MTARIPEVAGRIKRWGGRAHGVMFELTDEARRAIQAQDRDLLGRLVSLVNEVAEEPDADPEIENALAISFLKMADLMAPHGNEVWRMLSPTMRQILQGSHQ